MAQVPVDHQILVAIQVHVGGDNTYDVLIGTYRRDVASKSTIVLSEHKGDPLPVISYLLPAYVTHRLNGRRWCLHRQLSSARKQGGGQEGAHQDDSHGSSWGVNKVVLKQGKSKAMVLDGTCNWC
jgi:hypothetical protein